MSTSETVANAILGSSPNKKRKSPSTSAQRDDFVQKLQSDLVLQIKEDVGQLGSNYELLREKVSKSDSTLGKIADYLRILYTKKEERNYNWAVSLLDTHSLFFSGIKNLAAYLKSVSEQRGDGNVIVVIVADLYGPGSVLWKDLQLSLMNRKQYHEKFIAEGNQVLRTNGQIIVDCPNAKLNLKQNAWSEEAQYL